MAVGAQAPGGGSQRGSVGSSPFTKQVTVLRPRGRGLGRNSQGSRLAEAEGLPWVNAVRPAHVHDGNRRKSIEWGSMGS